MNYGGVKRVVCIDSGWKFNQVPGWRKMGVQPTYAEGILPYLEKGMFPVITRYYREALLLNSLGPRTILELQQLIQQPTQKFVSTKLLGVFIAMEIAHRTSPEECVALLQEVARDTFLKAVQLDQSFQKKAVEMLRQLNVRQYADKSIFDGLILSHSHTDHSTGVGAAREELLIVASSTTVASLIADHTASNPLAQDSMVIRLREADKVGRSYPTLQRPYYVPKIGVPFEIGPDIWVTALPVNHIAGSLGFLLEVNHHGRRVASFVYPGDYKDNAFFESLAKLNKPPVDLLFLEGTNPPRTSKSSAFFDESSVAHNFSDLFDQERQNTRLIICDIQKNNFERIRNLVNAAHTAGRTVLMTTEMLDRLTIMMQNTTVPEVHLDFLKKITVQIWKRKKATYTAAELRLHEVYGAVTTDTIAANPAQYLIIRTQSESPEKLSQLAACPTVWVRSESEPFTTESKTHLDYLQKTAKDWGWLFLRRGFHSSGHAPILESTHPDAAHGVLTSVLELKPR